MEHTKYFPVYFDSEPALRALSDEERGRLIIALLDHAQGREVPELSPAARVAFLLLASGIDRHAKRYAANVANGRKGGAPRGNQNASKTTENNPNQSKTSEEQPTRTKDVKTKDEKTKDKDNPKAEDSITSATRKFSTPSVDDVRSYCQERKNGIDAQRFFDFYASKGWRVGNQPMKDWRAAVRTWEAPDRKRQDTSPRAANTTNPFKKRLLEEQGESN